MTTDTAVRVTRIVIQEQSGLHRISPSSFCFSFDQNTNLATVPLKDVPYVDHPDLKINEHESTQMPFRYVKDNNGDPIMPKVSSQYMPYWIF